MFAAIDRVQDLVNRVARSVEWLPPAVARLTVGVVFALSGWGKLHNLEQVTSFFTDLGIPAPAFQAAMVSTVELVGGALLVAGLLTRYAALPLIVTMIVAILTAQRANVTGLGALVGLIEFAYIALLLWLAVAGGGRLSLDHLLGRLLARRVRPQTA
jgi:putative oxidoreductase